jgi:vancomycin resistance protein YoaR
MAHWMVWARLSREVITGGGTKLPIDNESGFIEALERLETRLLGSPLQLVAGEQTWELIGSELDVHIDRLGMWQDVAGRPPEGYLAFLLRPRQPRFLPIRLTYDEETINQRLAVIGQEIWCPPRNARPDPQTKKVVPEESGQELDIPATRARLLDAWRGGEPRAFAVIKTIPPATTVASLRRLGLRHLLASFSSTFDPEQEGRVHNIRMAATLLDGTLLLPGEVFSFNTVVGPRTLERGFRAAPEIVNQEMVWGVGGGICQVSSTLYNAALLSGLQIVERRPHSRPLGYIGLGRDATVYYGAIDFRFANTHPFPILLSSEVVGNRVSLSIWGSGELPVMYTVVTEVSEVLPAGEVIENDPSMPLGESVLLREGREGRRVETWLVALEADGSETWRQRISQDLYPPQPSVLRQNLTDPSLSGNTSSS